MGQNDPLFEREKTTKIFRDIILALRTQIKIYAMYLKIKYYLKAYYNLI
jgi:hypothetical protein